MPAALSDGIWAFCIMSTLTYLRNLVADPHICSVTPTSRFGVRRLCGGIDFSRAKLVVEYGPGLGVFTDYLLKHMPLRSRLMVFETNPNFLRELRQRFKDPRLVFVGDTCEKVRETLAQFGNDQADYILSGIPFSFLKPGERERVLLNTALSLKPDGRFLTYQFFPPPASLDNFLLKPLKMYFDVLKIEYELRNIPPLRLYQSRIKEEIVRQQEELRRQDFRLRAF